tara:strand:- start:1219 stop:1812 length:594 start_codon:yes stop_codon:yes gene_type:complete
MKYLDLFACPVQITEQKLDIDSLIDFSYEMKDKDPEGVHQTNIGGWQSKDIINEKHPEFVKLKNKIEEAANAYHTNIDLKKNEEQIIVNIWININGKGHLNDYHCHHYSVLSGAFYLRPGSAPIVFQHPYRYINSFYWETNMISKWNPVNSSVFTILPEANNLIIFPAWIEHKVLMNMEDTERISFSFNTHLKLKGE